MMFRKSHRWTRVVLSAFALIVCVTMVPGCGTMGWPTRPAPPNPIASSSPAPGGAPLGASPAAPRPQFYDFPDIPIPHELKIVSNDSYVFQSGTFKTGLLTLRGRVELNSLINFFQMAMPRENWKPKGGFRYRRSVLIFEKPDKICVINLYDKMLYSYVEIYVAPVSDQV